MSLQRAVLRLRRPTSWKTRVVLVVLAADAVVALMGMWVVPAILQWPAGLGALLAAVGAHRFWLQDGAIGDFHRSGSTNLGAFLLQDMYGAMVAHQVLSVAIGIAGGLLGSAIVWASRTLARASAV